MNKKDPIHSFETFRHKDALYRIRSTHLQTIKEAIIRQRAILEEYIKRDSAFLTSLVPIDLLPDAPLIAITMAEAARLAGVGPMAAVAGAIAHAACDAALSQGARIAIVENGGDIYCNTKDPIVIALYAGKNLLSGRLALSIKPEDQPLSICSSSSTMGHSLSFGNCDLATVIADSGALADAVATLSCNSVKGKSDVNPTLERVIAIPGVRGAIIIKEDVIGLIGKLPEIIKHSDAQYQDKITRDEKSDFYLHSDL